MYRHIARLCMECISAGISCISAPLSHASLHLPALQTTPPHIHHHQKLHHHLHRHPRLKPTYPSISSPHTIYICIVGFFKHLFHLKMVLNHCGRICASSKLWLWSNIFHTYISYYKVFLLCEKIIVGLTPHPSSSPF